MLTEKGLPAQIQHPQANCIELTAQQRQGIVGGDTQINYFSVNRRERNSPSGESIRVKGNQANCSMLGCAEHITTEAKSWYAGLMLWAVPARAPGTGIRTLPTVEQIYTAVEGSSHFRFHTTDCFIL